MTQSRGHQVAVDFDVPARMRDGTILRANVYRPASEGQWPVLLTRLPYGKDLPMAGALLDPLQVARQGYVVIIQDTRGRFTSGGEWTPMQAEAEDGYDTIEWASKLNYSNGEVGMFGISYFGFTQWSAMTLQPPALKTAIPIQTWNNPLNGTTFRGGALELGTTAQWQMMMGLDVLLRRHRGEADPRILGAALYQLINDIDALGSQGYASLPLREFAPLKRNDVAPAFFDAFPYEMQQDRVNYMTILGKHEKVIVPTFNIAGWYDIFLQDTIENFRIMRTEGKTPEARQSKLLVGPWSHGGMNNPIGELNFGMGSTAAFIDLKIDLVSLQVRWFDHYLKGVENGIEAEAPIKLFVMGANIWRDEQEWPLARAVETRYYLHSNGHANTLEGDGTLSTTPPEAEESDNYTYDPANPVSTRGGALLMTPEYRSGPYDQRPIEQREDVLVYSTPPLEQDTEVTGPITVRLWATSSAPDTDFIARLVDVSPDGYAQNLTDGIIRARHRHHAKGEAPSLIEPGQAYEYEIDLWSTSNLFKQGHRIRVDITSSSFPRWDRNPNTGHDLGVDAEFAIAQQTILHDAEHPSSILLPIIPAAN
ncbi:CocE/NonD family hydrolase [Ktedonospora formicarum]|uniref:X-Pro dipeptidyl-peptidase n=1 Tax=Ktedonospora formicarum TaxID=2778364 RepID=A0A8J3I1J9_9CHLR|nr:CocE/NonD family hydrolase [Ktedonospora formicarum]GHO43224.1 X-Pro dipeptidyl-peptidase [Ktedonospora formicarum]